MSYHFLKDGNGIIACYDMYPTQFRTFMDMISYLPSLKQMGFNALWINPMQMPGDISDFFKGDKNNGVTFNNEVTRSLYAMSDPFRFNPLFSLGTEEDSSKMIHDLNKEALQSLTKKSRELDIVPMFDLVLNHVAIDSPICQKKPHWVKSIHEDFKDVRGFNYDDETIRKEIINEFWKPYVKRYMIEYGFDGVRVDAVGYVHPEVRHEIYEYIHLLAKKYNKPTPVILDESLFCKRPLADEVEYLKLPSVGPTHITTEVYNTEFSLDSKSLPEKIKQEEQLKASVVFQQKNGMLRENAKGGCINFSGNHDYLSLAMTVLFQMAAARLKSDKTYGQFISLYNQMVNNSDNIEESSPELNEPLKTTLLYSYVSEIQKELEDIKEETAQEFNGLVLQKLALSALTGSGGWFILSGDETCDTTAKSVFQRKGAVDASYYPQREHGIFTNNPAIAEEVLEKMAVDNFILENSDNQWMTELYQNLSQAPEMKHRLLVSHIDNIKNQINAGIVHVQNQFADLLCKEGIHITFDETDFNVKSRTHENGWLGLQNNFEFIKLLNDLLKKLPISLPGFSSDMVRLKEKPDLVIVVRKNGWQLNSEISIVVVNLDQQKKVKLTIEDIQLIAKQYCDQYFSETELNDECNKDQWQTLYNQVLQAVHTKQIHTDDTVTIKNPKIFEIQGSSVSTFFSMKLDNKDIYSSSKKLEFGQ